MGSDGNLTAVASLEEIPQTKGELMKLLPTERIKMFHDYFPQGHRATRYEDWYDCPSSDDGGGEGGTDDVVNSYPIEYEHQFEPYVVGSKRGVHYFDDDFRGFGYNKAYWLAEAHLRGYRFEVLCDVFVVHAHHSESAKGERKKDDRTEGLAEWYEREYWPARYNYTEGVDYREGLEQRRRESALRKEQRRRESALRKEKRRRESELRKEQRRRESELRKKERWEKKLLRHPELMERPNGEQGTMPAPP
jgi:hypothetical protein